MIEPITATPMVEPMERKKVSVAVTSPSCRYGKAFWTTMVKRLIITPIPTGHNHVAHDLAFSGSRRHAGEQEHAESSDGEPNDRQYLVAAGTREKLSSQDAADYEAEHQRG